MRAAKTIRTSGTHSSSRAAGRSAVAAIAGGGDPEAAGTALGPVLVPGEAAAAGPDAPGTGPSAAIAAASPGAMLLSAGSKRSTAKRIGARGSAAGELGSGLEPEPGVAPLTGPALVAGEGDGVGAAPLGAAPLGAAP